MNGRYRLNSDPVSDPGDGEETEKIEKFRVTERQEVKNSESKTLFKLYLKERQNSKWKK